LSAVYYSPSELNLEPTITDSINSPLLMGVEEMYNSKNFHRFL